jgi:alpha-N-arabinofuranosidase
MRTLLIVLSLLIGPLVAKAEPPTLLVRDDAWHPVDKRLFGQFMEIASWGEPGPEAFVNDDGTLPPEIVEQLRLLNAPVIRFPGGTDIDFIDWTQRIDNAPGRTEPGRPAFASSRSVRENHNLDNSFGYDELLNLVEELDAEAMLVVNLRDATAGRRSVEEAAMHAAGLVAYANAEVGAKLPDGMPDWPSIRAKNGRREPWKVNYVQVGNEAWVWPKLDAATVLAGPDEVPAAKLREVYLAYAKAIHAVDPDVLLICDARVGGHDEQGRQFAESVLDHDDMRAAYRYLATHDYAPWSVRQILQNGSPVDREDLSDKDVWQLIMTVPDLPRRDDHVIFRPHDVGLARKLGYLAAATEWNWNGMGKALPKRTREFNLATGLGVATYLHALIKQGDVVRIGTQSMMLGTSWAISGVYRFKDYEPVVTATAMMTSFYAQHHGNERVETRWTVPPPMRERTLQFEKMLTDDPLPLVEAVATRGENVLYVHLIHRKYDEPTEITLDLGRYRDRLAGEATAHRLVLNTDGGENPFDASRIIQEPAGQPERRWMVTLPPASVTILEIPLGEIVRTDLN